MDATSNKDVFSQSLERCNQSDRFITAFYDRFLSSSDEVKEKFESTDFERQTKMLRRSLELCSGATNGEPIALRELDERATTHDRHHLDIPAHLYDLWLEAIIQTASEFDDQWDETVAEAWRTILGYAVAHMVRRY